MFEIRPTNDSDINNISRITKKYWGADIIVVHGIVYKPSDLPGFIAYNRDNQEEWLGLITYNIKENQCEIVTINAITQFNGIGTALLKSVKQTAIETNCKRIWLITTNDNIDALRFYQKRGFNINAIHCGVVNKSRKLKPEIPMIGEYGIPLRDEIEPEMRLFNDRGEVKE